MLNLALIWWLLSNSAVPAPDWCWVCWWILLVVKIIDIIAHAVKFGMKLGE